MRGASAWLEVEMASMAAWSELGVVPASAVSQPCASTRRPDSALCVKGDRAAHPPDVIAFTGDHEQVGDED